MAALLAGFLLFLSFTLSHAYAVSEASGQVQCDAFKQLDLDSIANFTLVNTTYVDKAALNLSNTLNAFPFCRLNGQVAYGSNDTLAFELWLPDSTSYTGHYLAVGNGGMAGTIDTAAMMLRLNAGFAVAGGDSGHLAALNNDGNGAPGVYLPYLHDKDQVLAWIHNSIALFTVPATSLVEQYYGQAAGKRFYVGCSTGGAQAFALAQFHPELFDGIVAGSPGNWYSHLALSFLWNEQKTAANASYLPQERLDSIRAAVLEECDGLDGVVDGVLENPLKCPFDVGTLACGSGSNDTGTCLSAAQVEAARAIYQGPRDSRTGASLYPGFDFGSEGEWLFQEDLLSDAFAVPILQNLVYANLSYDPNTFNWGSDVDDVDEFAGALIDEISPDLTAFWKHGGKMMVTQGWADPFNAGTWPIQHLHQIQNVSGNATSDFFKVFMIPGFGHCRAADSYPSVPADFDSVEAVVAWVTRDEAPVQMMSYNPPDGSNRTRKLCAWPETAVLVGEDQDSWTSYVCQED